MAADVCCVQVRCRRLQWGRTGWHVYPRATQLQLAQHTSRSSAYRIPRLRPRSCSAARGHATRGRFVRSQRRSLIRSNTHAVAWCVRQVGHYAHAIGWRWLSLAAFYLPAACAPTDLGVAVERWWPGAARQRRTRDNIANRALDRRRDTSAIHLGIQPRPARLV